MPTNCQAPVEGQSQHLHDKHEQSACHISLTFHPGEAKSSNGWGTLMFVSRHITIARHVLVADDDETDVYLLRHAFRKAGLLHTLVHVHDGQEVIDYLSKAKEPQPKLPDLVLLDLKMPRLNGFDVLTWLSARKDTISLPVVVLSTSSLSVDRERAKRLGAHDYLVKPNNFEELTTLAKGLDERWFQPS